MPKTPGQRDLDTFTPRNYLIGDHAGVKILPGPTYIDATYAIDGANTNRTDELRAGCLMARLTSGLWVPLKRTQVASGGSGSGSTQTTTELIVEDARFFKAGDVITFKSDGADVTRTISSINYTTNRITVSQSFDDVGAGEYVYASTPAGAGVCRGILYETVRLKSPTPFDTTEYDTPCQIHYAGGLVDEDSLLGDLDAVRDSSAANGAVTHYLSGIQFGDQQGID